MIRFEDPITGHSEYWYDSADVSKALMLKDPNTNKILGRNKFLQLLRYNGLLMKDSNQPKQVMITLGLMRFHMVQRRYKKYGMLLISEKGITYIENKFKTGDMQIGFQKRIINKTVTLKLDDVC